MSGSAREVRIEIGGLRAALETEGGELTALAERRYAGFLSAARPDWRFRVGRREHGLVPLADVVVRQPHGTGRIELERHDFLATLDVRRRVGDVALGAMDEIALDAFLRVAYSIALLDAGALLLHASSVARDGRGYVFPGRSGSGKTTVTRLSPGATLLSDELSIVGREGRCYGTPFWGELARAGENRSVPAAGLYLLRQADHHAATPLRAPQALAALLPNVVFFARDPGLVARVFDVAADVVERVPCFDLAFRRDPGFWDVIQRD
jgi:hypothetical protein